MKSKKNLWGLLALSLIMFMVTLDTTITNIALPDMTTYFESNLADTNWISTIYVLVMSIVIIPAAKFGDQFGRKRLMMIGLLIFGIGSTLCGLSRTLPILIINRFIQGVGGAIVMPIMIPLSVSLFGRKQANQAVGIIGAVTAVAAAAGPPIGGMILRFLDWKWIFFVNVPIVILTLCLVATCFAESVDPTAAKKIDIGGLILLTLALSQLTFVLVKGYDFGWTSSSSLLLIFGAIISFTSFIVVELKTKAPLVELSLFRETTFAASVIIYFICGFAVICSSLIFNFFLEDVRRYSALNASYIIMFMSITVMVSMPLGAKLAEYVGYRNIITTGMVLMAISLFLLSDLKADTVDELMVSFMIVLGLGFGFACLSIVAAVQFIPENKAGIASGIVNAARQLGTCLGIALLVGTMTHNVAIAKTEIKREALVQVTAQKLPSKLAQLINKGVTSELQTSKNSSDTKTNLQSSLKKDVQVVLNKSKTEQKPHDKKLVKVHNGLTELAGQFENQPNTVSGLAVRVTNGSQALTNQYTEILYDMIKSNPNAASILAAYKAKLVQLNGQRQSSKRDESIQRVRSLIGIYQVGLDPNINSASAFIKELNLESKQKDTAQYKLVQAQTKLLKILSKNGKVHESVVKVNNGVTKIDLDQRMTSVLRRITVLKNQKLTVAFTKVFLLAAWIVTGFSVVGLFTERKRND